MIQIIFPFPKQHFKNLIKEKISGGEFKVVYTILRDEFYSFSLVSENYSFSILQLSNGVCMREIKRGVKIRPKRNPYYYTDGLECEEIEDIYDTEIIYTIKFEDDVLLDIKNFIDDLIFEYRIVKSDVSSNPKIQETKYEYTFKKEV